MHWKMQTPENRMCFESTQLKVSIGLLRHKATHDLRS